MKQVLSLRVADQDFAVDLLKVQEIRVWEASTPIPYAQDFIEGLMNLRGTLVPVFCLRKRLKLDDNVPVERPIVIVFSLETKTVGAKVDSVCDVHVLEDGDCKPPPDLGNTKLESFIQGLATVDEHLLVILNIEKVLNPEEECLEDVSQQNARIQHHTPGVGIS